MTILVLYVNIILQYKLMEVKNGLLFCTRSSRCFFGNYEDLTKAILKAQVRKNTAKSKVKYEFWLEVENKLKEIKGKKKNKWED